MNILVSAPLADFDLKLQEFRTSSDFKYLGVNANGGIKA